MLGGEFSKSEYISGLGIGLDYYSFNGKRIGISFGIGGGPAWGKYRSDLSDSYIKNYAFQEMTGDTYDSHSNNDKTNGGWNFDANLLFQYWLKTNLIIGIGPRVTYFSKQAYSVFVTSSDAQYIYTENVVMPYREKVIVPGGQISLFLNPIIFKYSLMKIKGDDGYMHMFGLAFMMTTL